MSMRMITAAGLKLLSLIIQSCPISITNGGKSTRKWLHEKVLAEDGAALTELRKKSRSYGENSSSVFADITEFAKAELREGCDIDEILILHYFAGNRHATRIQNSLNEKREEGMSNGYASKALIMHMLLPVKVISIEGSRVSAAYKKEHGSENIEITMHNLGIFSCSDDLPEVESMWLTHYGMLLCPVEDAKKNLILTYNPESRDFLAACGKVGKTGIDVDNMHFAPHVRKLCGE